MLTGLLLALAVILLGSTLRVPLVALGPGPTYDTLGQADDRPVVAVTGLMTYPTSGQLNMTTVSVSDRLTMFRALGLWAAGDSRIVPREDIYPPDKTDQEVEQEIRKSFVTSEVNAEVAALGYLHRPIKVMIGGVGDKSPAVGLLSPGDQLLAIDGRPIESVSAVYEALRETRPGQQVTIRVLRAGAPREVAVTLGSRPDGPQGFLDVTPSGELLNPDEIMIGLTDVGGPSAGLIFALAVVDKLTPGELTGGRFVAGTGEISQAGDVGPIGGIPFKMMAARAAGATVFLVPAKNCEEAMSNAPEGLQLVKVGTLGEAVSGLDAVRDGRPPPAC